MNKPSVFSHPQWLSAGLALACAGGVPAYATTTISGLQADANYSLGGGATVTEPTQTATPPGTTHVDILQFTGDGTNNIGLHTYADSPSASFGSRASGDGTYTAYSNIQVTGTFDGGAFSSSITPGQLFVQIPAGYAFADASEYIQSHLLFTLVVDGATTFTSDAFLKWNMGGITHTVAESPGGFSIGYAYTTGPTYANFWVPGTTQTIGGFDASITHTFAYSIIAEAEGKTHAITCAGGGGGSDGGHGVAGNVAGTGGGGGQGLCSPGSDAQSGDPLHSLPEPGSAALFGAGLASLLWPRPQRGKASTASRPV